MVTGNWSETGVTWASKPSNDAEKMFTANIFYEYQNQTKEFYITRMVRGWLQLMPNHGLLIKERLDGLSENGDPIARMVCRAFATKEYAVTANRPKLVVTYTTDTDPQVDVGTGNGSYYIKNRATGEYLSASGSSVQLQPFSGGSAQLNNAQKKNFLFFGKP